MALQQRDAGAYAQCWDYTHGVPVRELIIVYLMPHIFSSRPTAQAINFNITYYVGIPMRVAEKRYGFTHRLIGIFAHEDGPDPNELGNTPNMRWGTQVQIKESLRLALRQAVIDKMGIPEERIQHLDRAIASVM